MVVRSQLRRLAGGVLATVVVIGLLFGGALAATAGSRRSASAIDRFLDFSHAEDGFVVTQDPTFDLGAVEDLPQVQAAGEGGFLGPALFRGIGAPSGESAAQRRVRQVRW